MKRLLGITALCFLCLCLFGGSVSLAGSQETLPTLAVFPSWLPGEAGAFGHFLTNSLYDILDGYERFQPVYSAYPGDGRYDTAPLPKGLIPPDLRDKLWEKKSFLTPYRPNANLVYQLGEKLGVDAVIMYSLVITGGGRDQLTAYLFDIQKRREISRYVTDELKHNYTGEIAPVALTNKLRGVTDYVLLRY